MTEDIVEAWVRLKEWLEPLAGDNCDLKASQNEVETFNAMEEAVAKFAAIRETHAIVPREPTNKMHEAGVRIHHHGSPLATYTAMIAAAEGRE